MNTRCRPFTFAVLFLLAMLAVFAYQDKIRQRIGADAVMAKLSESTCTPHPVEEIVP